MTRHILLSQDDFEALEKARELYLESAGFPSELIRHRNHNPPNCPPNSIDQIASEHNLKDKAVIAPEGLGYADLSDLAEAVVVYFHGDIKEIFTFSRSALEALDTYFAANPPLREFKYDFLFTDLIPALGAYFGKVMTYQLGGRWHFAQPLLKSTVVKPEAESFPFRVAYSAVVGNYTFVQAYEDFKIAI